MESLNEKPSAMTKFKSFVIECKRIWQVTKKPSRQELFTIVKVTGIGMLAIGFIGFLISIIWQLLLR